MNERIEQGKEPSIEDIKKRMEETNNESFYQAREQRLYKSQQRTTGCSLSRISI
jgi:hypothetical protein